jgi:hypothetical protein
MKSGMMIGLVGCGAVTFAALMMLKNKPAEAVAPVEEKPIPFIAKLEVLNFTEAKPKVEAPKEPLIDKNAPVIVIPKTEPVVVNPVSIRVVSIPEAKIENGELDHQVSNLVVDRTGRRIVFTTNQSVNVFNTQTGEFSRRVEKGADSWVQISSDGRFFTTQSQTEISIHSTETMKVVASFKNPGWSPWSKQIGIFSPKCDLYYATFRVGGSQLSMLELSTLNGSSRVIPLKEQEGDFWYNFDEMKIIPGTTEFLAGYMQSQQGHGVRYDIVNSRRYDVKSISNWILSAPRGRGMQITEDGRFATYTYQQGIKVVDIKKDKEILHHSAGLTTFRFPTITPDQSRLIYAAAETPVVSTVGQYPPTEIHLRDLITGSPMATFVPFPNVPEQNTKPVQAMDLGHDGTYFVIASGGKLHFYSFEKAFGIKPLPIKRNTQRELSYLD